MPLARPVLTAILLLCPIAAPLAADGAELYRIRLCHTCHGEHPDEPVLPLYPKLAGQTPAYLFQQMKDIRDGKRTNGLSVSMRTVVGHLSDADLQGIADWLASQ